MAILMHRGRGERHVLRSEHLIGRGPRCQLVLDDALVSSVHAQIRWQEKTWEVHDLDSRNGTYVDGRRLERGERLPIAVGALLAFGAPHDVFELLDDSPPMARAMSDRGVVQEAQTRNILPLPSPESPMLTVFERHGQWQVENEEGEHRAVSDGDRLMVGDEGWLMCLPISIDPTENRDTVRLLLRELTLRFSVNLDEEQIDLSLVHAGGGVELSPRVHMEVLLRLAEARLDDRRAAAMSEEDEGWIYVPELLTKLCIPDDASGHNLLCQHIYQARQQFLRAGILDAVQLVQRRTTIAVEGTRRIGQIRLGVSRIQIVRPRRPRSTRGDSESR